MMFQNHRHTLPVIIFSVKIAALGSLKMVTERIFLSLNFSIARNSGIYTKFTIPRQQETKVVLQKDTDNVAESICNR
jgi:hypothetical protein